jgi:hypothetical protein
MQLYMYVCLSYDKTYISTFHAIFAYDYQQITTHHFMWSARNISIITHPEDRATHTCIMVHYCTHRKFIDYNFKTFRCNLKCALKQPSITRASEHGPIERTHVRRFYWLNILVKFYCTWWISYLLTTNVKDNGLCVSLHDYLVGLINQ